MGLITKSNYFALLLQKVLFYASTANEIRKFKMKSDIRFSVSAKLVTKRESHQKIVPTLLQCIH